MRNDIEVHDSCGNVFEDMGMSDAAERLAKADAARKRRKASRVVGNSAEGVPVTHERMNHAARARTIDAACTTAGQSAQADFV